jgi:hypothetical protein
MVTLLARLLHQISGLTLLMNRAPVALTTVAPDLKSFDVPAAEAVDGSADSDAAVALTTLLARLSNRISSPRQLPLLMPSHLTPSLM